jgi:thiamine biosynthesis protein ThiS
MTITVNGKEREFANPLNVRELLDVLGLDPTRVAVELNRDILPRARFAEDVLNEGDVLEIVQFVGGG